MLREIRAVFREVATWIVLLLGILSGREGWFTPAGSGSFNDCSTAEDAGDAEAATTSPEPPGIKATLF
jgi:hypothetical protein